MHGRIFTLNTICNALRLAADGIYTSLQSKQRINGITQT